MWAAHLIKNYKRFYLVAIWYRKLILVLWNTKIDNNEMQNRYTTTPTTTSVNLIEYRTFFSTIKHLFFFLIETDLIVVK